MGGDSWWIWIVSGWWMGIVGGGDSRKVGIVNSW